MEVVDAATTNVPATATPIQPILFTALPGRFPSLKDMKNWAYANRSKQAIPDFKTGRTLSAAGDRDVRYGSEADMMRFHRDVG